MKNKAKRLSKKIIFAIVAACVIGVIVFTLIGMQIAFVLADRIECWRPSYEKEDLREILRKPELSDGDYEIIFRQTGLTRHGVDRTLARYGTNRVIDIQNDFFDAHEVVNNFFAPFICQDNIKGSVRCAPLENGDILVSSSTHLSGWRIGHAGLVVNGAAGRILQANAVGVSSAIGGISDFNTRVNFMIFSPKFDSEVKNEVAKYATDNLVGLNYDPTAGVFSKKENINKTQCAHIVWYAYKQFGIDLDCNGGLIVTPRDLANSPDVELVQVFGFDIDKLWK